MKATENPRWMLVDDDYYLLESIGTLISAVTGHEVVCFSSPIEAIRTFAVDPSRYDVIISDFNMPHLDGGQMCSVLRAMKPTLRTILATGSSQLTDYDAMTKGFDSLLRKPFSVAELRMVIAKLAKTVSVPDELSLLQAA